MTTDEVINGAAKWSCVESDAVAFLDSLPENSVDLLVTSPPYEDARTYGIGFRLTGQDWVDWMVKVVKAAAPKVKGLIAINCEGQTRNYSYSGVPFLLFADLKRAGFNMRKPVVFHRVGIPGSGGPDWLRNDWEPVICVTRPGKLPWSDNVACGHTPKYGPGGELSHRDPQGRRRNSFGVRVDAPIGTRSSGNKSGVETYRCKSRSVMTRERSGTHSQKSTVYETPAKANPGNVVKLNVGGGQMGHALAHDNEAPFPLGLPSFFVKSFCPPGGLVCDPFTGSGTTVHAAYESGRRFVGCDVRASQVDLCRKRMATVTPTMFATGAS